MAIQQKSVGLAMIVVGLGLEFYFSPWKIGLSVQAVVGMAVSGIGLAYYAKAKGRSIAWCAIALLPIVGPILGLIALRQNWRSSHVFCDLWA